MGGFLTTLRSTLARVLLTGGVLVCSLATALARSDAAVAHFERAAVLAQEGKLNEAVTEYTLGLKLEPTSSRAIAGLRR